MKDPICINETGGKVCGHLRSEHDSGGACRAAWCSCSRLVTETFIENAASVPAQPEREITVPRECEYPSSFSKSDIQRNIDRLDSLTSVDGPTAAEYSAPTKEYLVYGTGSSEPTVVLFKEPDPLLAFNVETASFADLAVWAYKIQQKYREMKESSL